MSEVRYSHRNKTCFPTTMGAAEPGQTIRTGDSWSTVIRRTAHCEDPELVTLERVTAGGLRFTTDYPATRLTHVRQPG
jgi:hypothetical protein